MKPSVVACLGLLVMTASLALAQVRASGQADQRPGALTQDTTRGVKPGARGQDAIDAEPALNPPARPAGVSSQSGASMGVLSFSNFRLGPEDLIGISVLDAPEFTRQVRVSGDGTIRLPLIKEPVEAGGKTSAQLEQDITKALIDGGLLLDPSVAVTVLEFNSKPVSVAGAVRTPMVFQAVRPMPVGEAISRAGGLGENAGTDIVVTIPARDGQNPQTVHLPVKSLQDANSTDAKLLLRGGEEVMVASAGQVYMLGGVARPGAVLLNTEEPMTLLKALAVSGGTTPGTGSKAFLLRASAGGQKQEIMLDLAKLMKRKEPDLPLQSNDVVYIPDSKTKKLTQAGLNAAVSSFIYTIAGALVLR